MIRIMGLISIFTTMPSSSTKILYEQFQTYI